MAHFVFEILRFVLKIKKSLAFAVVSLLTSFLRYCDLFVYVNGKIVGLNRSFMVHFVLEVLKHVRYVNEKTLAFALLTLLTSFLRY